MKKWWVLIVALFLVVMAQVVLGKTETTIYEAEDAVLNGGIKVGAVTPGYSGRGYVTGFCKEGDSITFPIKVTHAGIYRLSIRYHSSFGDKHSNLSINGVSFGEIILPKTSSFAEIAAGKIALKTGENTIRIHKGWGWYDIDYIKLEPVPDSIQHHRVDKKLVNPNATLETKALFSYLVDEYGKKILSGQQDYHSIEWLKENIGRYPAIGGFDFMDYSPSRVEHGSSSQETKRAIAWFQRGGIVTFCWHWNAPTDLIDKSGKEWWRGFYMDSTTFNLETAVNNPKSTEYRLLIRDIDAIAAQLKILQNAGVPVLWRPLHEASGGWFWWGAKGPEPCKKLYRLLYDRLTNYHQLNNLIWVWNSSEANWYPGNSYVDIVSYDSYPQVGDYSPVSHAYETLVSLVHDKKLVTISENGPIPDPEKLVAYHAGWSWFCTWRNFNSDGKNNSLGHLKKVYSSDYVITLDKLPTNLYHPAK